MINKSKSHNFDSDRASNKKSVLTKAKSSIEIPKSSFSINDLNVEPLKTGVGEVVSISCTVKNNSDIIGEYNAELKIDDEIVEHQTIIIFGGKKQVISFNHTFSEPKKYSIQIGDLKNTVSAFAKKESPDPSTPKRSIPVQNKIELSDLKIESHIIEAGETAIVSCLLINNGQIDQQYKAELKIDNQVVGMQNIFLIPKQQQRVVFSGSIEDPGEHSIAIGYLKGKLVVTG